MMELVKPGETYDIYLVDDRSISNATIMSIDDHWMEIYHKKYSDADILETKIIPLSRIAVLREPETVKCWYLETMTSSSNETGKDEIYRRVMQATRLSRTDFELSKSKGALFDNYEDAKQVLLEIKEADREEMPDEQFKGVKYCIFELGKGSEEV